jgi:putative FmdB family regulatory protein
MPIYAYKCEFCGHAKDVLQKMSDPLLAVCPACGKNTFTKQVTAAGFQLKGSGWYVTDFRGGKTAEGSKTDASSPVTSSGSSASSPVESASVPAKSSNAAGESPASPASPAASATATPAPKSATPSGSGA